MAMEVKRREWADKQRHVSMYVFFDSVTGGTLLPGLSVIKSVQARNVTTENDNPKIDITTNTDEAVVTGVTANDYVHFDFWGY